MVMMLDRLKEINRVHLYLGIAILMTIPCYCSGLFLYWNNKNSNTDQQMTATFSPSDQIENILSPTFTFPVVTQTVTLSPTVTPTFTATITYVLPDTKTPTPSPSPTITSTHTSSPEPTETVTPSPSNTINLKQAIRNMAAGLMLVIIFLAGCNGNNILDTMFLSENATQDENLTQEPLQEENVIATSAPTEISFSDNSLSIWLPPQFDPNADTESGKIMLAHIESFQELYPQHILKIRIKANSGSSSILNALLSTSSAAPGVLPSVVLISRSDLEIAAGQGIIQPVEVIGSLLQKKWE
jgi:hypothetical protein